MPKSRSERAQANDAANRAKESVKQAQTAAAQAQAAQTAAEAALAKAEALAKAAVERAVKDATLGLVKSAQNQVAECCCAALKAAHQEVEAATKQALAQVRGEMGRLLKASKANGGPDLKAVEAAMDRETEARQKEVGGG